MFSTVSWQRYLRSTQNNLQSAKKHNGKCRKSGFNAGKHTFMPVFRQRYLITTKKHLKIAKKITSNTLNRFKVGKHTFSLLSWKHYLRSTQNTSKVLNKNGKYRKTDLNAGNKRFHPYLGKSTFD